MTPPTDAYIAGFIDGEGSLMLRSHGLAKGSPYYQPSLSIGNTNLPVLIAIRDAIGAGSITHEKRINPRHKPVWRYALHGRSKIAPLLGRLLPHLIIKRQQAEELLLFMSTMTSGGRALTRIEKQIRSAAAEKVRWLNRKGIA